MNILFPDESSLSLNLLLLLLLSFILFEQVFFVDVRWLRIARECSTSYEFNVSEYCILDKKIYNALQLS